MSSTIIDARLRISAEERASAEIAKVVKSFRDLDGATKVSASIEKVTRSLLEEERALKAVSSAASAQSGLTKLQADLQQADAALRQQAKALDAARQARAAFEGVKLSKGSEQAQQAQAAAKALRDAGAAYRSAEHEVRKVNAAIAAQATTVQQAERAAAGLGHDITNLAGAEQAVRTSVERATAALRQQIQAEDQAAQAARTSAAVQKEAAASARVAKEQALRDTVRAAERAARDTTRIAREEARDLRTQRAADAREQRAEAAQTARQQMRWAVEAGRAERQERQRAVREVSEARQARRDAWKGAAGIVGIAGVHKAEHFAGHALHTYQHFDNERRFGQVVMNLSDEEQKPLVDQAIHMGAISRYNDVKVLHAQRELAARGLNRDQVLGMIPHVKDLGQALDIDIGDAAKQVEAGIFAFKKDISTREAATNSAKQTADVQVSAAKISGMTPEDIQQAYKYGATPARLAHVSEERMLAFAGVLKKATIGGDEAGVAFRALMSTANAPTAGAKTAMRANGMDYNSYQKAPDKLALDPFVKQVAESYGVQLDAKARAGLGKIFSNKAIVGDSSKFTPAVMDFLSDTLGGDDAKSKKSIAGLANRYRNASMQGVDSNKLIDDLLLKLRDNLAFANSLFGSKQGGRIATALSDPETFNKMQHLLRDHSAGRAAQVSDARMAGFDGAVLRFQGAVTNLETKLGRAWDNDGKGGALTGITDKAGQFVQHLAEMDNAMVRAGSVAAALGAGLVAIKSVGLLQSGFGLKTSALALDASAAALTTAAAKLGGGLPGGGPGGGPGVDASKSKGGKFKGAIKAGAGIVGALGLEPLARLAQEHHIFEGPDLERDGWVRSGLDFLDPNFGNKVLGDRSKAIPSISIRPGDAPLTIDRGSAAFGLNGPLDPSALPAALPPRAHPKMIDAEAVEREATEAGRKAGDAFGKAIVDAPLPPARPDIFDPMKRAAGEAGTEAGTKTGEGIRSGIEAKTPEVVEQGQTMFERLKAAFIEGIKIPISFTPGEGMGAGGGGPGGIQKASFDPDAGSGFGGQGGGGSSAPEIPTGATSSGGGRSGRQVASLPGGGGGGAGSTRGLSARDLRDIHPDFAAHIRASALSQGIDPDVALRIANSEGLRGSNPNRLTPGDFENGKPTSFGPYQLHYGRSGGLGNRYTRETGHHAGDPRHWREQIDFALRTARREGWGAWYGRKGAGIGVRQGIGTVTAVPMPKDGAGEPELSPGLDGKAGIDLGNGTIRMPDGRIRSKTYGPPGGDKPPGPKVPEGQPDPLDRTLPPGGFGGRGDMQAVALDLREAVDGLRTAGWRSHHTVEVTAGPGTKARTTGMRATSSGPVQADVGVSMPQTKGAGWDI